MDRGANASVRHGYQRRLNHGWNLGAFNRDAKKGSNEAEQKGADWSWADSSQASKEYAGVSGAYGTLCDFFVKCREQGLPEDTYEQLTKSVLDLSLKGNREDTRFSIDDQDALSVLASAGVMSVEEVSHHLPRRSLASIRVMEFMSQDEVLNIFKERIMEHGEIYHKTQPALIRTAKKGENVQTIVAGRVISDIDVQDDTSWVVKSSSKHKEEYVLTQAKFESNWNTEGSKPTKTDSCQNPDELAEQGFKLHTPQLVLKWAYRIEEADLKGLPAHTLKTDWGALQTIVAGDYLVLPYPEAKGVEIYIIPNETVKGVYALYENPSKEEEFEEPPVICLVSPKAAQLAASGLTTRSVDLLKDSNFNRMARGDIGKDTVALIYGFRRPYNFLFRYQMDEEVLAKFISAIAEQYNKVNYHSWSHAFDVFQFIYSNLTVGRGDKYINFQDILALLLGALAHDVGHMGTTNNFLISTQADLAIMYNDKSPLENMHGSVFFQTLYRPGHNCLIAMSPEKFRSFRTKVIDSILATDMCHHFDLVEQLKVRVMQAQHEDKPVLGVLGFSSSCSLGDDVELNEGDIKMLLQGFMHMGDLGHCCRPFDVHKYVVVLLEEEFFSQGDQERELGMPISPMMDRSKDSAASCQSFFLAKLVMPLLTPWAYFIKQERSDFLLMTLEDNQKHWEVLCQQHKEAGGAVKTAKAITDNA